MPAEIPYWTPGFERLALHITGNLPPIRHRVSAHACCRRSLSAGLISAGADMEPYRGA